ncbi:MAG: flagellar hook protein FlgE [Bryobacterales bacterium]|nr:flagellar hook protein FlgE [Bryobacterales bacterium]
MFTSFSTALSALNAHSTAVDVVGNNLANLNTPGFKTSAVAFHDLVTQSVGAGLGETQVGFGVARPTTLRQFTQGAIQSTGATLDAAIQGDGFFVVRDNAGAVLYTRGGHLQVNKAGQLLTSTGERVQGWFDITGAVNTNAPIGDIVIPVGTLKAPRASTAFSVDLNLDSGAAAGDTFSTPVQVFDSLGNAHVVTLTFTRDAAPGAWTVSATIPGDEVSGGTPGQPSTVNVTPAGIEFDENGALVTPAPPDGIQLESITLANNAAPLELYWNLYTPQGAARLTQFAQPSAPSANEQDGWPPAQLVRAGIGDGGVILAQYDNGQQIVVGQLAMANIRNPESLIAVGSNNYQLSARSANPAIGLPGTGGRGTIAGGAIEYSTTDIAREFTNLIVLQRGYQANSRVVTTVDELSQETINLKR